MGALERIRKQKLIAAHALRLNWIINCRFYRISSEKSEGGEKIDNEYESLNPTCERSTFYWTKYSGPHETWWQLQTSPWVAMRSWTLCGVMCDRIQLHPRFLQQWIIEPGWRLRISSRRVYGKSCDEILMNYTDVRFEMWWDQLKKKSWRTIQFTFFLSSILIFERKLVYTKKNINRKLHSIHNRKELIRHLKF